MVDDREVARGLAFAVDARAFVDGGDVQQHFIARTVIVAPPPLCETANTEYSAMFAGGVAQSRMLASFYADLADETGVGAEAQVAEPARELGDHLARDLTVAPPLDVLRIDELLASDERYAGLAQDAQGDRFHGSEGKR